MLVVTPIQIPKAASLAIIYQQRSGAVGEIEFLKQTHAM